MGLERDGEVLLKSYAPPYYPSMEEAVHAVVADKYGPGGIYGGGERGVFAHRYAEAGWEDPERLGEGVPRISQAAIAATVAVLTYGWEEYGRFPTTYPPFHTLMGFQAGHIDESYYDEHFREGSLSESHRRHMERWH